MKPQNLNRSIAVLFASAAIPVAGTTVYASTSHASTTQKFKGPVVDMRWGPVRATISVKNKKITSVSISVSPENPRSDFIDQQAVPILRSETLHAQNAAIDQVSGATDTSDAYIESLQAAVASARKHKALK